MGCRLWSKGKTGSGYGACYPKGQKKQWSVHRWVYVCAYGPIPRGKVICHTCDEPTCFKLSHLQLGTQSDNIQDMYNKQRQGAGAYVAGEEHRNALLTQKDVLQIKQQVGAAPYKEIAEQYGVSVTAIADIKLKRTWSHL